jgi:hypothetical protein
LNSIEIRTKYKEYKSRNHVPAKIPVNPFNQVFSGNKGPQGEVLPVASSEQTWLALHKNRFLTEEEAQFADTFEKILDGDLDITTEALKARKGQFLAEYMADCNEDLTGFSEIVHADSQSKYPRSEFDSQELIFPHLAFTKQKLTHPRTRPVPVTTTHIPRATLFEDLYSTDIRKLLEPCQTSSSDNFLTQGTQNIVQYWQANGCKPKNPKKHEVFLLKTRAMLYRYLRDKGLIFDQNYFLERQELNASELIMKNFESLRPRDPNPEELPLPHTPNIQDTPDTVALGPQTLYDPARVDKSPEDNVPSPGISLGDKDHIYYTFLGKRLPRFLPRAVVDGMQEANYMQLGLTQKNFIEKIGNFSIDSLIKIATLDYSINAQHMNESWTKIGTTIERLKKDEEIFLENYDEDDATCDVMPILNDEEVFIEYLERTKYNPLDTINPGKAIKGKSDPNADMTISDGGTKSKKREIILNQEQSFFELRQKPTEARYDDYVCQVCSEGDTSEGNLIVFCSKCSITIHQKCYGLEELPNGDWVCDLCTSFKENGRYLSCVCCTRKGGAMRKTESHSGAAVWKTLKPTFWQFYNEKKKIPLKASAEA